MTGGANDRSTTIRKFANTDRQKVRRFGHTRRGIRRSSTPQPHYAPLSMADKNGGVGGCSFADRLAGLPGNLLLLPPSTIAEMKKFANWATMRRSLKFGECGTQWTTHSTPLSSSSFHCAYTNSYACWAR